MREPASYGSFLFGVWAQLNLCVALGRKDRGVLCIDTPSHLITLNTFFLFHTSPVVPSSRGLMCDVCSTFYCVGNQGTFRKRVGHKLEG
jgi:hypothetical protein